MDQEQFRKHIKALRDRKEFEQALEAINAAPPEWQHDRWIRLWQGGMLRQSDLAKSLTLLSDLHGEFPKHPQIAHELSITQRQAGHLEDSLRTSRTNLVHNPAHWGSVIASIETMARLNDFDGFAPVLATARDQQQKAPDSENTKGLTNAILRAVQHAPSIIKTQPWIWDHLDSHLDTLGEEDLLLLFPVYAQHQSSAPDAPVRLISALLAKESLSLTARERILGILHSGGPDDLEDLVTPIIEQAPQDEQGYLRMVLAARISPAPVALKQRHRLLPSGRTPRDCLMLARLLVQDARDRVAMRYMRRIRRHNGPSPTLDRDYLASLLASGEIDAARQLLAELMARHDSLPPKYLALLFNGLIETHQPEEALRLYEQTQGSIGYIGSIADQVIRIKQTLGAARETETLLATQKARAASRGKLQYGPSIAGTMQGELALAQTAGTQSAQQTLTHDVTGILKRHTRLPEKANGGRHSPPRLIHQYWDKQHPPEDIAAIIASWQGLAGFEHQLYNRNTARTLLRTELGNDWLRAFDNATSPAEEADLFRLCILMLRGGIYVDCDDKMVGDPEAFYAMLDGFTIFAEPLGHTGNNVLACPPGHVIAKKAAVAAKIALERRHNENTWFKTGPGLLSRTVAASLHEIETRDAQTRVSIYPRYSLVRHVRIHINLPYKKTDAYWNRSGPNDTFRQLETAIRAMPRNSAGATGAIGTPV